MRELRLLQWWPAAALAVFAAVAAAVLVSGLSDPGGGSDGRSQARASPASDGAGADETETPEPKEACPTTHPEASPESTLFDDLADGATTDDPDFEATFGAAVSDDTARAHADLSLEMHVPKGDVAPTAFYIRIPPKWGITPGCQIPIGLTVGRLRWDTQLGLDGDPCHDPSPLLFNMLNASTDPSQTVSFRDADGDGTPDYAQDKDSSGRPDVIDRYPDFLNRLFPGRRPIRRYIGLFPYTDPPVLAQSLLFRSLPESDDLTMVLILQDIGDPEASQEQSEFSDYCTPSGFRMTDRAVSEAGDAYYTNPGAGEYTFVLTAFGERDADGDAIENALDTCPFDVNVGDPRVKGEGDADEDGLDAACDPNDFEANHDQDGDGHLNRADICPLKPPSDGSAVHEDRDEDRIGDECDTSGNGPDVADGEVPVVVQAADVTIR